MSATSPFLSVIVPAHRGVAMLRQSLPALLASDLARSEWELIVVDDSSGDDTPAVAAEYADRVVRLTGGPWGPGYARNRGVEAARGEIVVTIDADVVVHRSTLRQFHDAFRADPGLGALFGSYDADPTAPGIVSQFRNLLHHHVHHMGEGPAETFWAGCGAIRRAAMIEVGMYDAWHFPRPQIEDIELGRRLRRAGHRIELRPEIQCTHLKRWTLRNMVVTDFRDRGVPWTWLLLSEGKSDASTTLNLRFADKLCTALVAVTALAIATAALLRTVLPLAVAAAAVLTIVLLNHRFYRAVIRARGPGLALASVPLHLIFYFTGGLGAVVGTVLFTLRRAPRPAREPAVADGAGWPPPLDRPEGSLWTLAAARTRK